jgi:hypothetical protein
MRIVLIQRIVVRRPASGTARGGMLPLHHGYSLQLFLHAIQGSIRAFQAGNRVARPLGADAWEDATEAVGLPGQALAVQ